MQSTFCVEFYKKKNEDMVYIFARSKNWYGGIIYIYPPKIVSSEASTKEIGEQTLRTAELASRDLDPPDGSTSLDLFMQTIGIKTWSTFLKKVSNGQMCRKNGADFFEFFAGKRLQGGHEMHEVCRTPLDDPKAIGEAVLKSLSMFPPK